jgi:dihydrodipicolinate reductase
MRSALSQLVRSLAAGLLVFLVAAPKDMAAQNLVAQQAQPDSQHLVSPSDLNQAAMDASEAREKNLDTLNRFFSSEQAQQALESAHMNPQEVKTATAGLDDEDLAQLASRANKAQADFAAGSMSDHDLLIILILVAALILIIVAVR